MHPETRVALALCLALSAASVAYSQARKAGVIDAFDQAPGLKPDTAGARMDSLTVRNDSLAYEARRRIYDRGLPELPDAESLRDQARQAGFQPVVLRNRPWRVNFRSGSAFSFGVPQPVGSDSLRILAIKEGHAYPETLSLESITSLRCPSRSTLTVNEIVGGLLLNVFLPITLSGGNFIPIFLTGCVGPVPLGLGPVYETAPPRDWLTASRFTGNAGLELEALPRAAFNGLDERIEPVPAFRLHAEGGYRRSPLAFGMSLRLARMNAPIRRESVPAEFAAGKPDDAVFPDSSYGAAPLGLSMSAYARVVWAETRRATIYSRVGGYFSLREWRDPVVEFNSGRSPKSIGAECGAGAAFRIDQHWSLGMDAGLLAPVNGEDFSLLPELGFDVGYALNPNPPASRGPGVTVSLLGDPRVKGGILRMEMDANKWNSLGFSTGIELKSDRNEYHYLDTYRIDRRSEEDVPLLITYSMHTDRTLRAWIGLELAAGAQSEIQRTDVLYHSPEFPDSYSTTLDEDIDGAVGVGPEAGVNLAYGIGLRAQAKLLRTQAGFGKGVAVGLVFALPAVQGP